MAQEKIKIEKRAIKYSRRLYYKGNTAITNREKIRNIYEALLSLIVAFVGIVIVGNLPGQLLKEELHLLVVNRIHGRVIE